jgi:RluA family pseudouridine synthase
VTAPSRRVVVAPAETGLRLDQLLAARTPLSRRAARTLISSGAITCNGQPVRIQSRTVSPFDVIDLAPHSPALNSQLTTHNSELAPILPYPFPPPSFLLETGWLVVADKPAGVLTQPAEVDDGSVPFDLRVAMELARRRGRPSYCRVVHRLDRVTSGVVLFAACAEAHRPLVRAWAGDRVVRSYLAVVAGRPDFATIEVDEAIARDPDHRWRFRCHAEGLSARTLVRVLHSDPEVSVVLCRLVTGRTHQVRLHLAHLGLLVLGDRLYGAGPTPPRRAPCSTPPPSACPTQAAAARSRLSRRCPATSRRSSRQASPRQRVPRSTSAERSASRAVPLFPTLPGSWGDAARPAGRPAQEPARLVCSAAAANPW